ncbi:Ig-like domain-containing protein [Chryseobacterium sp. FH1]|uniref:Ig-like domain-containing protein n=1 Tax=Chryseobacterium sp. FH1 TaxID=1233951 RepID=UPI0004E3F4F6|nr:Ig-like domain-containing protein [Chryseobacterium sp. FH1]KFC20472.1 hypothetical protein IO90_15070 [Chryseobacterium sp. FH1]
MKKYYFLLFLALFTIANAQTDLAKWALNSNGNVSYSDNRVIATSISTTQPISYQSQGMTVTGWNNGSVEHYRYFGFSVGSSNGNAIKISNLVFEQEKLNPGPDNYTIRYYIAPNSNNVDDYAFLHSVGSTILVNNESIVSNAIKNIPLNVTLSGTQRLVVRFFSSGNDWNAGWRIKANTLRLTEVQAVVPVANNDSYSVYSDTATSLDILSNDNSGSSITGITITQQPSHGTLAVNGATNVTYTPDSDYLGNDTFKYKSSNSTGLSNEANVNISVVQNPNTAVPVANNDSFTAYKNNESSFNILSNDTSVLAITGVTITQQPTHGTLIVNGTTNVTYKPTTGYTGTDSFKYKASNSTGLSNEANVSISVVDNVNTALARWNNSNFAPSFTNGSIEKINLTSTQGLSYVQDISISGGYNAFQTSGWPDKNAQTVDTSKFIQFTISPKQGYKLNLSEFNFECLMQSGDGNIRVDYSLNSNFSNPKTILPETVIGASAKTFSLTNFSRPIATDGQVLYLRIYVYNTWNAFQLLLKNGQNVGPAFIGYTESSSTAPIAYDDTVSNIVNNDIDIDVLVNDDYSNKINALTFTQPAHGSTTLNSDNSINYIPAKDYIGTDSFTYYITNEFGISNAAKVDITNNPNATTPLIRWDNASLKATAFQSFINETTITSNGAIGIAVGGETNPRTFYVETSGDNTVFNSSKYIQFVFENKSTNKTIEPKIFRYYAKGTASKYEIRYSKTADFSSDVLALSSGTIPTNYTLQSFNFDDGLKLEPGEKLYLRMYFYDTYYVQFIMQFITGAMGPEIDGLYYNRVYSPNNTIWLNPANPHWSNGVPNATKSAIIDTYYDTAVRGSFESKDLTINPTGSLIIKEDNPVSVHGQIINNAVASSFVVEHNANLLQSANAPNTGNITVKKSAVIPKMGYNYWTSPVSGQNLYQFSEGYNQANGGTGTGTPWNRFYVYNEANDYFVTSIANEITLNSSSTFQQGRGYAIRGKNSFPDAVTVSSPSSTFQFVGTPQNGDINSYNLKWTNAARGYNMVGNPYPSNLSFDDFFEQNKSKVYGVAYFWTNNDGQVLSQQSSNYNGNNYAIETAVGGTSATYFGINNRKPNGSISVGQGFIVQAKQTGKNQPLVFNNGMRTTSTANYYNKTAQKNRFWMEFKSPLNVNNEILIGYLANATNGYDSDFDADLLAVGSDSFWSIVSNHKLAIQAKDVNFTNEDITGIGFKASVAGDFTISITDKDGIFDANQTIYIKDKYQNKTFNLSQAPYTFYTNSGQYEDRFEIVYRAVETLGTDNVLKNGIQIYKDVQNFIVKSSDNLDEVSVYDAVGRLVYDSKVSKREILINKSNFAEGLYIIKARSGNTIITKKVLK